jgi:superfamily II DNA or RNA helicase
MQLRPYQSTALADIHAGWQAGHRNVLYVLSTGGGKTVVFAEVIRRHDGGSCAIAHRQELVGQMSLALARDGVRHRIIGPTPIIRWIIALHIQELGRDYYDPSARCAVAGVDTLIRRADDLKRWAQQVTLWITDEAHHLSAVTDPADFSTGNKWAKAVSLFPNARGLGVTATPERADGRGLARGQDGVFDLMITGPGMRDLITAGYLTDYRVFCPPSDLDLSDLGVGADGDYVRKKLALKTRKSSIMGDVVTHYQRIAMGKLGVTFTPDVETATELAARFNAAGVRAEAVSAKTPDRIRHDIVRKFARREILQLVNCDLFGEGFDLPAIEVVSMARATQSYAVFAQQFGRSLRPLDGKQHALIIDHVGNVLRHGLPDRPRQWSLDRRERRSSGPADDVIPLRTCLNPVCMAPFERVLLECPFCGWIPVPAGRTAPEQVDGDLCELDPATLAAMRGEVAKVDRHPDQVLHAMQRAGHPYPVAKGAANRHAERLDAQAVLREAMALWAGYQVALGRSDREGYRRFFHRFGCDVLSAQALGRAEAEVLAGRVREHTVMLDEEWRSRRG